MVFIEIPLDEEYAIVAGSTVDLNGGSPEWMAKAQGPKSPRVTTCDDDHITVGGTLPYYRGYGLWILC